MGRRHLWALVSAAIGCAAVAWAEVLGDGAPLAEAVKRDYAAPVRPIGVNGQVEWNIRSDFFKYPPTFAFTNEPSAAWYRFSITNETGFATRSSARRATTATARASGRISSPRTGRTA